MTDDTDGDSQDGAEEERGDEWLDTAFGDKLSEHQIRSTGPQTTVPPEPEEDEDGGEDESEPESPTPPGEQVQLSEPGIEDYEQVVLDRIDELNESDEPGTMHGEPGDIIYVPVCSSKMARLQSRLDEGKAEKVDGGRLGWWYPDSVMVQHPALLINPLTMSTSLQRETTAREHMEATRGENYVMADSGGYQIANANGLEVTYDLDKHDWKNYVHPERVIEWQVANSDNGTMLETPPYSYSKQEGKFTEHTWQSWYNETFVDAVDVSKKNTQMMVDRLEEIDNDDFTFMAIMHGIPRQDGSGDVAQAHDEWYEAIGSLYDWDAWALALGSADNPGMLTFGLGWFANNVDCDVFHALGQGNAWARILCKLYAQMTDTYVTHDGTGFKVGSLYSEMHLPASYLDTVRMTEREGGDQTFGDEQLANDRLPCGCGVCRRIESSIGADGLFELPATERSVLMDLHNLEHLIRRFRFIDAFVEARGADLLDDVKVHEGKGEVTTKSPFWEAIDSWFSPSRVAEVYHSMNFLVTAIEEDLETAADEYTIRTYFNDTSTDSVNGQSSPSICRTSSRSVFEQW